MLSGSLRHLKSSIGKPQAEGLPGPPSGRFPSAPRRGETDDSISGGRSSGFTVGDDRRLVGWDEIVGYFDSLDQASDRITVERLGPSTGGLPLILAVITSRENMAQLDRSKQIQGRPGGSTRSTSRRGSEAHPRDQARRHDRLQHSRHGNRFVSDGDRTGLPVDQRGLRPE